jgi:hypothetical protein
MNMKGELAKQLKDAGFPSSKDNEDYYEEFREWIPPTISELIDACGGKFATLMVGPGLILWSARGNGIEVRGETPEEAVANLWLLLNKKYGK